MSTIDKIVILLSEQNKKQKDLTDYIGIPKATFTDWKSGRIKSYTKYLPQIAEFFGVSVDYLLGKSEEKETDSRDTSVQDAYDAAPDEIKAAVRKLLDVAN